MKDCRLGGGSGIIGNRLYVAGPRSLCALPSSSCPAALSALLYTAVIRALSAPNQPQWDHLMSHMSEGEHSSLVGAAAVTLCCAAAVLSALSFAHPFVRRISHLNLHWLLLMPRQQSCAADGAVPAQAGAT